MVVTGGALPPLFPGSQGVLVGSSRSPLLPAVAWTVGLTSRQQENGKEAKIHYETTGPEIREDTLGQVDIFVMEIREDTLGQVVPLFADGSVSIDLGFKGLVPSSASPSPLMPFKRARAGGWIVQYSATLLSCTFIFLALAT